MTLTFELRPENLVSNGHWWIFVSSFCKIPPLSTEFRHHSK